jgi:hypothetical protein
MSITIPNSKQYGYRGTYQPKYRDGVVFQNTTGANTPTEAVLRQWTSYSGCDIVAEIYMPQEEKPLTLGDLQTVSISTHREAVPMRILGHTQPAGFTRGTRTVAGSMIFTVFNVYTFYRLQVLQDQLRQLHHPLADMLPPFDVTITFLNEYGAMSKMRIYGVTIVDEGVTLSIDDMLTESTLSYVARGLQPMTMADPREWV